MDIAALSMVLSQGKVQQQAGISVMKMAMGVEECNGNSIATMSNDMSKAMVLSVQPHLGANLDTQA
ncbi:putative motility protein [Desulfosporosinus fructosivorans]|uniref:Putative motility protein n=1 Tax=Desulfosporosinus fructosivorans TaxID=2018669 RepID=A0A4Z0QYC3_9FIRM|nr:YjfB family protein [Desulfosporosinus fructosivorans]TGE34747.1 putative motility protein [Desulfosporosinus fructosivorans]